MDSTNFLKNKRKKHRNPGKYQDNFSIKKKNNNILILHSCRLLEAYYNNEGITALVLDAEKMNTTNTLLKLGPILKKVIIVENNKETYNKMLQAINIYDLDRVEIHNCLMDTYLREYLNPKINVVYFDLNENFFTSERSYGSDFAINYFLEKSVAKEIILAATFCLRSIHSGKYDLQEKKILLLLEKIFIVNGFDSKKLISEKDMRYRGQKGLNKALMFVLYSLKRNENEHKFHL